MAWYAISFVSFIIVFTLVQDGICRSPMLDYRRDPVSKFYFRRSYATNGDECLDRCEIKAMPDHTRCITEFHWDDPEGFVWKKCLPGAVKSRGSLSRTIYSSIGDKCRDTCEKKGGFDYNWCIINIVWDTDPPSYDWSVCSPDGGKTTAMGLKCNEKCSWHCDGCNGSECAKCGVYKSKKWCYVQNSDPSKKEVAGVGWDYC